MKKLSQNEINSSLKELNGWRLNQKGEIEKTFKLKDFLASLAFVNAVGAEAEKMNHHPDIVIKWNAVTLSLTTHDSGGLTSKDFKLAQITERLTTK